MKIQKSIGFTFIEVLVAVGILGLILTSLLGFFAQSIELNATSQESTLAVSHAQYVLEEIRSSSGVIINQIDAGVWDLGTDAAFTSRDLTRLNNEIIDVSHDGAVPPTVSVLITWQRRNGRQEQLTFTTIDSGV